GVNITIPHKESVIRFLDDISEEARLVGAVNTIVYKDRKLVGYNTDGSGYMASLKEELGFNPKSKRIIIIGAGGAARGILAALATQKPKSITVANRTLSRAVSLIKTFKGKFRDTRFEAIDLDNNMLKMSFNSVDLLINTTSVGMKQSKALKIPLETLPKIAIVSDIIYNPLETLLLKKAKKIGLTTHGGLGMLVHQGARSFKLWTGMDAPMNVMRKAALKALKMEVGSRK
ncbi:MAG: shikimate dehydrogenase, partial [Deltaproteobacteria bacterium GWF2_42_12]